MAHDKNYYASEFHKYSIHRTEKGIRIDINFQPLGAALDRAQLALDNQVWNDMHRHMPRRDGELIKKTNALNEVSAGSGEVHVYDPTLPYAHYMYMGEKYIDPVWRVGGFYGILPDKEGQWWSRRGVSKIPSGEPLKYTNPEAVSLWDVEAIERYGDDWVEVVRRVLEGSDLNN